MQASKRTRTVIHQEWTLRSPAHSTELEKAMTAARAHASRHVNRPVDIWVSCDDDVVVVGYSFDQPQNDAVPAPRDGAL